MPEVWIHVRWPDGEESAIYSPSRIVRRHLAAGERLTLTEFLARSVQGLERADARVRERFGTGCGGAAASIGAIRERATHFDAAASVDVLRID